MPNTRNDTRGRTASARKAFGLYLKRYGHDSITPEEYTAELEYLYEVFKVKPNKTLYAQATSHTRSA